MHGVGSTPDRIMDEIFKHDVLIIHRRALKNLTDFITGVNHRGRRFLSALF